MKTTLRMVLSGLVLLVAAVFAAGLATAEPATSVPKREEVCMVQDTVMTTPAIPIVVAGKTYYGCCEMCKGRIAAEPTRYTQATDPVSGRPVDKATAALLSVGGRVLYFESEKSRKLFAEKAGRRRVTERLGQ